MFWLKLVSNFIKILREGQTPTQVAGGFALGSILGLSPMLTLQGLIVWLVILVLDVNLSAATLALLVFSLIAFIFDSLFHHLGYYLLVNIEGLKGVWTTLYNAPIAPLTRFNNTVKKFVVAYRTTVGARIENMKIYQVVSKSWVVQTYQRIRRVGV
jgi:uncharacterized protein (TIGR03546 family)